MIDLNKIINETLIRLEEEQFVETVVKKRLEGTITGIVDDVFREYSTFGKSLKTHIETNLKVNLDELGVEGYNTLVLAAIKEQLDKTITVKGIEKIKETTEEILSDVKDTYKLSEIIEKVKGESSKDEWEYEEYDSITLKIEDDKSFTHIYLDEEEDKDKYDCDYQINIMDGKVYSIKLKGNEINTKKILGGFFGVEELLFKVYASGSKIELDCGTDPEDYSIYYRVDD